MSLLYSGSPLNGDANDNFLIDWDGDGVSTTINAGAGDDFVLGDITTFWLAGAAGSVMGSGSVLTSSLAAWNLDDNPDLGDGTGIPHTMVYNSAVAGHTAWYQVIVGAGELDIGHDDSALHRRTETGVFSVGGYHSVSTGKYTTAPMFAAVAADRVLAAS